ncbi:zinc-ribbon domain-containing protein [Chloroflexota bacterium]
MFCSNCGCKLTAGARFCSGCGNETTAIQVLKEDGGVHIVKHNVDSHDTRLNIGQQIIYTNGPEKSGKLCPGCRREVNKEDVHICDACSGEYCIHCEIMGLACPSCGTPVKPLAKLKCGLCGQIFGIPTKEKFIIEQLDRDTEHSVKQRCQCPVCFRTTYYSGSAGFTDLGSFQPLDVLDYFNQGKLVLTWPKQFKVE